MAGPSRFSNIESEPVTVTKPSKVTGPRRLKLVLIEPTDLGERLAEVTITDDMLANRVMPISDVLRAAYNRLQELLPTE